METDTAWRAGAFGPAEAVVLFDGECSFCHSAVRFLYKRDPEGKLRYCSLQSKAAARLLRSAGIEANSAPDSFALLLRDGRVYWRSEAALRTARLLGGAWRAAFALRAVPKPVRDRAYDWFARRRRRWFGGPQACSLPPAELRERIIGD
ncbi:thiol-disulfide oxidoreductase DCC family protein [Paenibacillus thermoaerophilus]|uniref:Thiol-disulfide oxidoreductase DCC family protein n=1 Tax=Paenibacillus thermoaerophilus TaxID=1215385 RepID=A0ABW2V8M5_9BACL|nr:DCC1-like thiol-disulfide oxidoreductase family protein [Paenibacillus thermoaerophilus]TMV16123.1 DUF393 domain-containing protein [Paenibacillus thermoaerophilus]